MQGNDQQAYDRGITIFSPDGRLYQVEYAREAVKRGTPSVGVRTADGVVLAAVTPQRSPLLETESIEKLHKIDDHLAIASAGHAADARQLVDFARRVAQGERLRYGESADTENLTKTITDEIQEYTQTGGARPFGAALLVAGVDEEGPRLMETDPSGTPYEWQAAVVGGNDETIRGYFEDAYEPEMSIDAGIDLALEGLAEGLDGIEAQEVDLLTITEDGQNELDTEAIADRLADIDVE